jgi:hypothetical protein
MTLSLIVWPPFIDHGWQIDRRDDDIVVEPGFCRHHANRRGWGGGGRGGIVDDEKESIDGTMIFASSDVGA